MSNVLMLSAIVMLVLLFFKVPVFIAVLGGSMVYFVMNPGINTVIFAQQAIIGTEKISLMAIPFFVCAGIFMNYTGVTKRIMDFCEVVTGRLPGGLAQVKRTFIHRYGRTFRIQHRRCSDGVQNDGSGDDKEGLLSGVLQRCNSRFLHDHTADPTGNRDDPLRMYRERFHR